MRDATKLLCHVLNCREGWAAHERLASRSSPGYDYKRVCMCRGVSEGLPSNLLFMVHICSSPGPENARDRYTTLTLCQTRQFAPNQKIKSPPALMRGDPACGDAHLHLQGFENECDTIRKQFQIWWKVRDLSLEKHTSNAQELDQTVIRGWYSEVAGGGDLWYINDNVEST